MFRLTKEEAEALRSQFVISNMDQPEETASAESLRLQIATSNVETSKNKAKSEVLRSQIAISSSGRGGRRHMPYAFTEQGIAMLSGILKSPRAVLVNIEIMRAFVMLRRMLASNAELAAKLDQLERNTIGNSRSSSTQFVS